MVWCFIMLNRLGAFTEAQWSNLSGNEIVLTALVSSICNGVAVGSDDDRTNLYLIGGALGSGLSALSYQLEHHFRSQQLRVLSIERHPQKSVTLFSSDLVYSLKLPAEVSEEIRKHKGKSALDEAYWHLLLERNYDLIIIRDAHEWVLPSLISSSQSLLAMQELVARCPCIPIVVFAEPGAAREIDHAVSLTNTGVRSFELSPMENDRDFEMFIRDIRRKLLAASDQGAEISQEEIKSIHSKSKGLIGYASRLVHLSLADAGALRFNEAENFEAEQLFPINGESFSSWMGRMSVENMSVAELNAFDVFSHQCAQLSVDPDSLYEFPAIRSCFNDRYEGVFQSFRLPTDGYLPFRQSTSYCPECLKADIRKVDLPAWRSAWRQLGMCICCDHASPVMLLSLSTPHYSPLDKAWRAYTEYVSSPSSRLLVSFPLISNGEQAIADNQMLLRITARVQSWVLGDTQIIQTQKPTKAVLEFLLGVWLCDPAWRTAPGFACSFFFPQRKGNSANFTPDTSFADAPPHYSWATPRQIAVAYWMLGVAFNVISFDEALTIRDVCRPYSLPFPVDRNEIRRVGLGVHARRVREEMIALAYRTLCAEEFEQVIWALR